MPMFGHDTVRCHWAEKATFHQHNSHMAHASKRQLQNQAVSSLPMHNPTVPDLPINNLPGYIQNLYVTGTSYITTNPMLHSHATSHYWYINIAKACMQSLTLIMQSPITIHHGSVVLFHRSMHRAHPVLPTWDTWMSFNPQSQTQCTTVLNKLHH